MRLQDQKVFPRGLTPAGVRADSGGMAGLEQDWWTDPLYDPSLTDWGAGSGWQTPVDWGWGGAGAGGGGGSTVYDPAAVDWGFNLGAPVETLTPPAEGTYYPTAYDYGAAPGVSINQSTGDLTFEGYIYAPPEGASVSMDPGWKTDDQGRYYWSYADGAKSYLDGTTIWPDGSYSTPDGYWISPSTGQVRDPAGTVTQSTTSLPSALQAIGAAGSSLLNFAKGLIGIWSGAATPPPGTQPGQVYRASNGQYYRLNADGTSTLTGSPMARPGGILGGASGTGLLLVGGGLLALLALSRRGKKAS